jgi:hypothetical protein
MSTIRGKFCSPATAHGGGSKSGSNSGSNAGSCYTRDQLVRIAKAINQQYKGKFGRAINVSANKDELWAAIESTMVQQCDTEWCWAEQVDPTLLSAFRPPRPEGKTRWLSTIDIREVLSQYMIPYKDFVFLGPVSIDFCSLAGNEVCKINLKTLRRNGKTKIGIVFNTDPHTEPGRHWISMFIDITHPDPKQHEIGYFDSFGMAPMAPEVKSLVAYLRKQNPDIKIKLNCSDTICTHSVKHQRDNTECGVYSISFIVARLTGKSWEEIVLNNQWQDSEMIEMRKVYFRPSSGRDHVH